MKNTKLTEKEYILQLINNINKGNSVSVPSIDMRVIRKNPTIIYEDNLKAYLLELEQDGYIEFFDEITLKITQKGIVFLKKIPFSCKILKDLKSFFK